MGESHSSKRSGFEKKHNGDGYSPKTDASNSTPSSETFRDGTT
jgi:hypothetical protein